MGSPRWFYESTGRWLPVMAGIAGLLLVTGIFWGLAFAPPDYQQGNSARIIISTSRRRSLRSRVT